MMRSRTMSAAWRCDGVLAFLAIAGTLGLAPGPAWTDDLVQAPFAVRPGKPLAVAYHGRELIAQDAINYLPHFDSAEPPVVGKQGAATAINLIQRTNDTVQFRRETALYPDGVMELTVRMRLLPYKNTPDRDSLTYSWTLPVAALEGARFKAVTGRVSGPKIETGSVSAKQADGELTHGKCRYIAFKSDRLRLVFDFNPYGVFAFQDFCGNGEPVGCWSIVKQGDKLIFSFGSAARSYGGIFSAKVLAYEGEYDYDQKHPYRQWTYNGATPPMAQFSFGAVGTDHFTKANRTPYTTQRRWGWERDGALEMTTNPAPALIDNCVFSPQGQSNTFVLDVTPGYYLATLRVGHTAQHVGPFRILMNGICQTQAVAVAAGASRTILLSQYVRRPDTQLKIGFDGPGAWALQSLVIHPVIYQNEDFTFDRRLWAIDGLFSPAIEPWPGDPP